MTGERMRLVAVGGHLPDGRASNVDRLTDFGIGEDFLDRKIGVRRRALKAAGDQTSDLCVAAFADLRERVPLDAGDIQLVCVVTQNPDTRIPHTAAIVHHKLGLPGHCMTFDISQGCAGYPHGLALVSGLAERFGIRHALLFTCDPYSTIVDPEDKNTALLFGDAATATYLTTAPVPGHRVVDANFGTAPGTSSCLRYDGRLVMDGRQVFLNATREVPAGITALLDRNGLDRSDIDLFLLHPGSKHLVDTLRRVLGVDESRLPFQIAEYGNTVSSSIPLMLGPVLTGRRPHAIVLSGFGVGFSWGNCLLQSAG